MTNGDMRLSWGWLVLVLVPFVVWSKDVAVAVLVLATAAALVGLGADRGALWRDALSIPGSLVAGLLAWTGITHLWTPDPSLANWLKPMTAITLAAVCVSAIAKQQTRTLQQWETPVLLAGGALCGLLLVERLTGAGLIGLVRHNETLPQRLNVMNGGLVLVACAAFPVLILLNRRTSSWLWPGIAFALVVVLATLFRMDAVPLALLAGGIAFVVTHTLGPRAVALIGSGLAAIALAWAPLAAWAFASGLHDWIAETVHPNWGYRITIWAKVADMLTANPLLGFGFDASPIVGATADLPAAAEGRTSFHHPHNGMLQVWLEMGVIGPGIVLVAGSLLMRRAVDHAPDRLSLAAAAATLTAASTIWLLSFGIWQSWWIATLGLSMGLMVLVYRTGAAVGPS